MIKVADQRVMAALRISLIFGASGIRGLGQWLFVYLLIRIDGPPGVGMYGLVTAMIVPITSLVGMQLQRVLATDVSGQEDFGAYVTLHLCGLAMGVALVLPGVYLAQHHALGMTVALFLQIAAFNLIDLFQARLLLHDQRVLYGLGNVVVQIACWTSVILVMLITDSAIWGLATSGVVAVVVYFALASTKHYKLIYWPALSWRGARKLLGIAWPMGLAIFVDLLGIHSPRLFLGHFFGNFELGIFVGLLTFLSVATLMTVAVSSTYTPWITATVQSGLVERIQRARLTLIALTMCGMVVIAWLASRFGPTLVGVLLEREYSRYHLAIVGVALCGFIEMGNAIAIVALNAARKLPHILWVSVIVLFVVLLADMLAVPKWGISGAVGALFAGIVTRAIMLHVLLFRLERFARNERQ